MKAVAKTRRAAGLDLVEVPEPTPKSGEFLIQVEAASLCGSDLEIQKWEEPFPTWMRQVPVIVGHEFSGSIVDAGQGAPKEWVGKRVAVDPGVTCNVCWACRAGQPNLCADREIIGIDRDGAFASFVSVPSRCCYPVPDTLSSQEATLLESFGVSVHAYRTAGLQGGEKSAVIGPGPIGLGVVAQIVGLGGSATVIGAESDRHARLKAALQLGAESALSVDDPDDRDEMARLEATFDLVFCTTGAPAALSSSLRLARRGGVIVMVGVTGAPEVPLDLRRLVLDQIQVRGVRGRETEDWRRALLLIQKMDLRPLTGTSFPLDDFSLAYDACERGDETKVYLVPA